MYQHKKGKKGSGVGQSDLIAKLNIELNNLYAKISSTKRGTSKEFGQGEERAPNTQSKMHKKVR